MKKSLRAIRLAFSRELVRHLAARLGEPERAVGKALKGMVPLVLCQLVIQAGEGEGRELFSPVVATGWPRVRDIRNLTEVLALLGGGPNHSAALEVGEDLLTRLFRASRLELDGLLAAYAGLRHDSTATLLRLVAAVVASELAQHAAQEQLTALRLSEELGMAKNQIYDWLPADLPRWPGYRRRAAVNAPHAVWAAELARPYWVLVLAAAVGAVVLALLVLEATALPVRQQPAPAATQLAVPGSDSVQQVMAMRTDSAAAGAAPRSGPAPVAW
jgi:hypothetical protein